MSTVTIERPATGVCDPVAAADWKPVPYAPTQILVGAVHLMQARGRAYGSYELQGGEVCALGALAVAAGKDADCWDGLASGVDAVEHGDVELIEAARLLVQVIAPWHEVAGLMVEDLIEIIGDWHDGECVEVDGKATHPHAPFNSTIFEAFGKAAEMAAPEVAA